MDEVGLQSVVECMTWMTGRYNHPTWQQVLQPVPQKVLRAGAGVLHPTLLDGKFMAFKIALIALHV